MPTAEQIHKALGDIQPLLLEDPTTFIDIALRFVAGKKTELAFGILRHIFTAHKGLMPLIQGSVGTFVQALVENPALVLQDPIFQEIATMPKVLQIIQEKSKDVSDAVAIMVPALAKLKPLISSLAVTGTSIVQGIMAEPHGTQKLHALIQSAGMVIDPAMTYDQKSEAATRLTTLGSEFLKLKQVQEAIINPALWREIAGYNQELAVVAGLPEALVPLAAELIKEVATVVQKQPDEVKAIIELTALLIDPKTKDQDKMKHLFGLGDKAIALAKSSPATLATLQTHKGALANALSAYMPVGIDVLKVVEIMIKPSVLATLEKAYTQYRDGGKLGIVKAVATVATSLDLLKLAGPAALVFIKDSLLNWIPDFMRRYHVKEAVNDKLASRGDEKDLKTLCKPSILELDPIRKHTLNGCFKGLKIKHDLNDFTIDGFDFRGASLGIQAEGPGKHVARLQASRGEQVVVHKQKEGFSLANSKISNSNFKGVEFKGDTIDLSGMEIDEASFESLAPSILRAQKKGKTIKAENIKITGETPEKAKAQLERIMKLSAEQKTKQERFAQKGR